MILKFSTRNIFRSKEGAEPRVISTLNILHPPPPLEKGVVSLALTDPHEFGIYHKMKNNRTPSFEKTYFVHFGAISAL